jgi:hypothetical protein
MFYRPFCQNGHLHGLCSHTGYVLIHLHLSLLFSACLDAVLRTRSVLSLVVLVLEIMALAAERLCDDRLCDAMQNDYVMHTVSEDAETLCEVHGAIHLTLSGHDSSVSAYPRVCPNPRPTAVTTAKAVDTTGTASMPHCARCTIARHSDHLP